MGSLGQRALKLLAVKVEGLKKKSAISQCAPGFPNQNQKVHGIFHFYIVGMYKTDQN